MKDSKKDISRKHTEYEGFREKGGLSWFRPWMIPALAGALILAILICIPLWRLTLQKMTGGKDAGVEAGTELEGSEKEETSDGSDLSDGSVVSDGSVMSDEGDMSDEVDVSDEGDVSDEAGGVEEGSVTDETAGEDLSPDAGAEVPPSDPDSLTDDQSTTDPSADGGTATDPSEENDDGAQTDPSGGGEAGTDTEGGEQQTGTLDPYPGYVAIEENVTAKNVTNLRSAPTTEDQGNIVGQLVNGESLLRVAANADTGWSRLEYNGEFVYAVSQYLTTDLGYRPPVITADPNRVNTLDGRVILFENCDDYITPKEYVNLRTEPSTTEGDATVHCQVQRGERLHRTGISGDSGWSRVEYDGRSLYVVSSYMTAAE